MEVKRYQPLAIEVKWQKIWQEQEAYKIDLTASQPSKKFYAFGMFNYPSGEGIHVGHVKNFTIPDVLLRFKRQQGYAVYSPVGFDSFGLPAENYALKTGVSPRETTDKAITNYSRQYQACGFSFDWSKVIDTSQPDYYRWTQWCFLQLYHAGLAYRAKSSQWWCDSCVTVLADEQVINGKCWRHDSVDDPLIGRKHLEQWFFKITDYADDILQATDDLNWTEWVKTAQKNYIGKSVGYELIFKLKGLVLSQATLSVFTTAVETLDGATFMVLAPEHALVAEIIQQASNGEEIADYLRQAQAKSELERQQAKTKTGVKVESLQAINPLNDRVIDVWIADYVLAGYGQGAIMAVPSNDERDLAFAKQYDLPVIHTTTDQTFVAYKDMAQSPQKYFRALGNSMNMLEAKADIIKQLKTKDAITEQTNFRLRDWLISRQRYWGAPIPIVYCDSCGTVPLPEADLPLKLPEIKDYKPAGDGRSPLAKIKEWVNTVCPKCGQAAQRETDTMDGYVCSSWYQMRYLSATDDQQAWDAQLAQHWLPVDFYNGADHATAHLIYARFFTRFFYEQKLVPVPEPFAQMYLHAKILAPDGQFFSKSKGNGINPLDIIEEGYGADALRVYICYIAPPNVEAVWDHHGVPGAFRFLQRVWVLIDNYLQEKPETPSQELQQELLTATHRCIDKCNQDLPKLKFNTALAALMELVNQFYKLSKRDNFQTAAWLECLESLTMLLAPFAPHLASEVWQRLGHQDSVHHNHWPEAVEAHLKTDTMTLSVQIDGKLRGELTVDKKASKDEIIQQAKQLESVARYLKDCQIIKEIYIPGRTVNLVSKS